MKLGWIGLVGLVPLMAVGMLLLGARMGAVPFGQVVSVGWSLGFGAFLMGMAASLRFREGGAKQVLPYLMIVLCLAEGLTGTWVLLGPEDAAATLVRANHLRMGELRGGYIETFGDDARSGELAEEMVAEAPYPQIFAFHHENVAFSSNTGVVDGTVTRLSREEPAVVLKHLDGALRAFGNEDGQLGPLAAPLDMNADQLDGPVLMDHLEDLTIIARPGGPFERLSAALLEASSQRLVERFKEMPDGDRALADLVHAALEDGAPFVRIDSRGAPAGLHVMDHIPARLYLQVDDGADKVVKLRYRELRAGEIVKTNEGHKPVDVVKAGLDVTISVAGETRYEHTFRGESPIDSWTILPPGMPLRDGYRNVAVDALNRDIATQFTDVAVP